MTAHDGFQELLGAYALDAVDDDERRMLEEHLRGCAACREEVAQHREVAAEFTSASSAEGGVPDHLWGRVAAALHADEPAEGLAPVYPLAPLAGRLPRRRWAVAVLAGAAAVVAAALGILGWQVHRQSDQVDRLRAADSAQGVARAADAALADPRAHVAVLASPDGRVQVTSVLQPDGTGYLLRASTLPPLPAGMTYQLWGVVGPQKISLGLLGPAPSVVAFHAGPGTAALAITAESGGGVVQSVHAPVVSGAVTV